ncbi:uncharacterized mitochondrial protein AtMg00810-like [Carya illinoinensis]|uniref:uncharacterized mitochondrial protein AtMg00810-like n=1 Tax=Carya illinoinensis TaxID=32201 RepID=UPI001C724D0E|nr:uncharacterized mitochondrial protein AtMg00810-like [Carya illinoinensis]
MNIELEALEQNRTWIITDLPLGKDAIDCKYVYKTKFKSDGSVERLKQSRADYSLFTKLDGTAFIALLVHVDDIIVAGNCSTTITALKSFLNSQFKIKDLGPLCYFLGLEVARSSKGIHICQRKYALDILADSRTLGSKPTKLPINQNFKLSKDSGDPISDPSSYRRLIGRLLYLTLTRPDLCYVVQLLSQFMDNPRTEHSVIVHKVLRYIKAAPGQGILLPSTSQLQLKAYCDSYWVSCPDTRRSTTG